MAIHNNPILNNHNPFLGEYEFPKAPLSTKEKVAIVAISILCGAIIGAALFFAAGIIGAVVAGVALGGVSAYLAHLIIQQNNTLSTVRSKERYRNLINQQQPIHVQFPSHPFVNGLINDRALNRPSRIQIEIEGGETVNVPDQSAKDLPRLFEFTVDDDTLFIKSSKKEGEGEEKVEEKNDMEMEQPALEEKEKAEGEEKIFDEDDIEDLDNLSSPNFLTTQLYDKCITKFNEDVPLVSNLLKITTQAGVAGLTVAIFKKFSNNRLGIQPNSQGYKVRIRTLDQERLEIKLMPSFQITSIDDIEHPIKVLEASRKIVISKQSLRSGLRDVNGQITDSVTII